MARRDPDPAPDLDPLKGGLKHNPFAALGGRAPARDANPPAASPPSTPRKPVKTPQSSAPPKPAAGPDRVTVRQERAGRGGKTVTIADGPGLAGHDLESLAREISRALGLGARLEDGLLVIQGDQRERLVDWLQSRGFGGVARGN